MARATPKSNRLMKQPAYNGSSHLFEKNIVYKHWNDVYKEIQDNEARIGRSLVFSQQIEFIGIYIVVM
jgi:hypothetical protein